ncbi:MAG: lysophospholipid acyltransferase family protein [bacterium]
MWKGFPLLIGRVEYFLSPGRDTLLAAVLLFVGIHRWVKTGYSVQSPLYLSLALFSFVNFLHRHRFRKALCDWVLKFDSVEPNAFFDVYDRCLGSFSPQIPASIPPANYSYLDYRKGNPVRQTLKPLICGAYDTATLAKLAILAMKLKEGQEGINAFDAFARIWGARFVARAHLKLHTLGQESLSPLKGKILLLFNHKSYLDFALNFFALGNLHHGKRHLRPRFIAAKDHFIDNPVIYSWLGLGKCIERAGMIFINRQKGKGWLAMKEAADKLVEADVEVAVYPQGTRAWGLTNEKGERIDAGYYTTVNKKTLNDPRGHLKAGTAQLILDTALRLREKGEEPLQVLFVGIDGTATVGPKGSFKIQTESEVTFRIGRLWKVELPREIPLENPQGHAPSNEAQENYLDEIEAIHLLIDREMEKTIGRHRTLMDRVLKDPRLTKEEISLLKKYLERADETENIAPFVVLDRLYALPESRWNEYLRALTQLAFQDADAEDWEKLRKTVSQELLAA